MRRRENAGKSQNNEEKPKKSRPFSGRYNPKLDKMPADSILPHSVWSKIVMILSILAIIYITSTNKAKETSMARHNEVLESNRFQSFVCSPSYRKEIDELGAKGCIPAKCGRLIADDVASSEEVIGLLRVAKKAFSAVESSGGLTVLDLHTGALTTSTGENFVNVFKDHPNLFSQEDFLLYSKVVNTVRSTIENHFKLEPNSLHFAHPCFFSKISPSAATSNARDHEYWHIHADKETYPDFHYTALLYLADYLKDFTGGRFIFVDNVDKMNRTVDPRSGRMVAFTSGIENRHHIEPVNQGKRFALTMGFTCNSEKAIEDPSKRK